MGVAQMELHMKISNKVVIILEGRIGLNGPGESTRPFIDSLLCTDQVSTTRDMKEKRLHP